MKFPTLTRRRKAQNPAPEVEAGSVVPVTPAPEPQAPYTIDRTGDAGREIVANIDWSINTDDTRRLTYEEIRLRGIEQKPWTDWTPQDRVDLETLRVMREDQAANERSRRMQPLTLDMLAPGLADAILGLHGAPARLRLTVALACQSCGTPFHDGDKVCSQCGAPRTPKELP